MGLEVSPYEHNFEEQEIDGCLFNYPSFPEKPRKVLSQIHLSHFPPLLFIEHARVTL